MTVKKELTDRGAFFKVRCNSCGKLQGMAESAKSALDMASKLNPAFIIDGDAAEVFTTYCGKACKRKAARSAPLNGQGELFPAEADR